MISVGKIFKAITGSDGIPSEKPAALRLGAVLARRTAIRQARRAEKELSGLMLTSNGKPQADLDQAGRGNRARSGVTVLENDRVASLRSRRAVGARRGAARGVHGRDPQALVCPV